MGLFSILGENIKVFPSKNEILDEISWAIGTISTIFSFGKIPSNEIVNKIIDGAQFVNDKIISPLKEKTDAVEYVQEASVPKDFLETMQEIDEHLDPDAVEANDVLDMIMEKINQEIEETTKVDQREPKVEIRPSDDENDPLTEVKTEPEEAPEESGETESEEAPEESGETEPEEAPEESGETESEEDPEELGNMNDKYNEIDSIGQNDLNENKVEDIPMDDLGDDSDDPIRDQLWAELTKELDAKEERSEHREQFLNQYDQKTIDDMKLMDPEQAERIEAVNKVAIREEIDEAASGETVWDAMSFNEKMKMHQTNPDRFDALLQDWQDRHPEGKDSSDPDFDYGKMHESQQESKTERDKNDGISQEILESEDPYRDYISSPESIESKHI